MYKSKVDKFLSSDRFFMPTGDGFEADMALDDKGCPCKVGKINVYERIQAERDSTDISIMMQRFRNGEVDVFDQMDPQYIDTVDYPHSLADLHAKIEEANELWSMLDDSEKSKFENLTDFLNREGVYYSSVDDVDGGDVNERTDTE